ncbi:MAG: hypothetical protein PHW64_09455 [Sulfuricurvum sp.]|nr:hypothetical protein [Sulfuricurvum sp.]
MRTIFIPFLLAASMWAAPYKVGDTVALPLLKDQFSQVQKIDPSVRTYIMVFEKGTSALLNTYLSQQEKGYLANNNAVVIADISQMPRFIATAFALPKMQKYTYPVVLIEDEELGLKFPAQEEKITVLSVQNKTITGIRYVSGVEELRSLVEAKR